MPKRLFKFGTKATGFTSGFFGPFKCGNCKFSEALPDYKICTNEEVGKDPEVTSDDYGNKIIESDDCCNQFTPIEDGDDEMLEAAKAAESSLDEKRIFCPLVKVDEAKREVWGVVTAEEVDKEGEICDFETTSPYYQELVNEMSKATDGANIFPLRAMHGLTAAGKGIGIEFRKEAKEIYMGFKVVDDAEWKKVQESVYTGFSQGGKYIKRWKDGEYMKYTAKPSEVSLVDLPCCTRAHFDYVKADGSVVKKVFKGSDPVGQGAGGEVSDVTPSVAACSCSCPGCKGSDCSTCSADTKCQMCQMAAKVKNVKYLIDDKKQPLFPVSNDEGKISHRLMRAAWSQLNEGFPGKKYEGPFKKQAVKKLTKLFIQEDLETPTEKGERIIEVLKTGLTDVIQNRAYGQLGKGMYQIGRFAQIMEDVKWLWIMMEYERLEEGDDSPVTDEVHDCYMLLLDHLLAYTEEEVQEMKEHQFTAV